MEIFYRFFQSFCSVNTFNFYEANTFFMVPCSLPHFSCISSTNVQVRKYPQASTHVTMGSTYYAFLPSRIIAQCGLQYSACKELFIYNFFHLFILFSLFLGTQEWRVSLLWLEPEEPQSFHYPKIFIARMNQCLGTPLCAR